MNRPVDPAEYRILNSYNQEVKRIQKELWEKVKKLDIDMADLTSEIVNKKAKGGSHD